MGCVCIDLKNVRIRVLLMWGGRRCLIGQQCFSSSEQELFNFQSVSDPCFGKIQHKWIIRKMKWKRGIKYKTQCFIIRVSRHEMICQLLYKFLNFHHLPRGGCVHKDKTTIGSGTNLYGARIWHLEERIWVSASLDLPLQEPGWCGRPCQFSLSTSAAVFSRIFF